MRLPLFISFNHYTMLTTWCVAAMYSSSGSLSFGATNTGGEESTFSAARTLCPLLLSNQIFYLTFS
jgi:hypothetical protein